MYKDIRKISVGAGFPNKAMHYQIGTELRGGFKIHEIIERGEKVYDIYISDDLAKVLWKTVENMPVVIELNIDFE